MPKLLFIGLTVVFLMSSQGLYADLPFFLNLRNDSEALRTVQPLQKQSQPASRTMKLHVKKVSHSFLSGGDVGYREHLSIQATSDNPDSGDLFNAIPIRKLGFSDNHCERSRSY